MTQFFASGGQNFRASASASVLPMNIQDYWGQLGLFLWPPRISRNQSERQSLTAEASVPHLSPDTGQKQEAPRRFREETSEGETAHLAERRCCRLALSHLSWKSPGRGVGGSSLSPPCWLRENQRLLGPTGYYGGPEASMFAPPDSVYRGGTLKYKRKGTDGEREGRGCLGDQKLPP